MPSHMPSTFASAAAGQASNRDQRSQPRAEPRGSGDWNRKEPRNTNGTLTLRRSSTTPHNSSIPQSSTPDSATALLAQESSLNHSQTSGQNLTESFSDSRYSKDRLLEIYKSQQFSDESIDVSRLFVNNWDPSHSNGSTARGWGKNTDTRDHNYGPEICWDQSGQVQPIGLEQMTALEKSIFATDVNSPLKPPPQNSNKDQTASGATTNGRKSSVSHGPTGAGAFGLSSPSSSRPTTRRRETSDSVPHSSVVSPTAGRGFNRDESGFLGRRSNDSKDGQFNNEERTGDGDGDAAPSKPSLPFGGIVRSNTSGSTLGNGPSSPWGNTSANTSLSPMGNFGSFGVSSGASQATSTDKPGFGSVRGESRLAHLMPKSSVEDMSAKGSESSRTWRPRPRTDTDPFGEDSSLSGGVMSSSQDIPFPSEQGGREASFDTPKRQTSGSFGLTNAPGFRDPPQRGQNFQNDDHDGSHEPLSPETNPYASPQESRSHGDESDSRNVEEVLGHVRGQGLASISDHHSMNLGGLPRGLASGTFEGSDRSQTSSAGGTRGFPSLGLASLGGTGALGGWPTSANAIGTPDRERMGFQSAFSNSLFGPMGELQSPSLSGLNGAFASVPSGTSTIGRGSKLGSLFPAAMQAQMQNPDNENESQDPKQASQLSTVGKSVFGSSRDTESHMRSGREPFDDMFSQGEQMNQTAFPQPETSQGPGTQQTPGYNQPVGGGPTSQQHPATSDATGQVPQTQQRTMVMPDRMRWVYLDPQGNVQGPFSGLEMHDWYKASFFTADLSVKKVEDPEFEPLGQLIRRIGNSREPFLVPQIGVPHGPPAAPPPFGPGVTSQSGVVQPPFAGAFPSFGTTLTAEQQNNLERRKQEEQYLMARQREFLAQQQVNMKQMQMQGGLPSALHHHSSAHSLQSQPSFGSITSPVGIPQGGPLPPVKPFFDGAARQPATGSMPPPDFLREDEVSRLSLQDRQTFGNSLSGSQPSQRQAPQFPPQPSDGQRDLPNLEQMRLDDPQGFKARLREFEQLRAQQDMEQGVMLPQSGPTSDPIGPPQQRLASSAFQDSTRLAHALESREPEPLSLTQQVKNAASAKQTPAPQPESPWAKVDTGLPMPFPPPQSTTPLPAPTAQRGRSNLPEALNIESRSRSETPEAASATPSIAPWAKEPSEAPRGPSLKEIQEAEAKKAAKLEEAAVAARRAALEQEMRSQPVALPPAPGLPMTSNWASGTVPAVPAATPSAWVKNTGNKTQSPSSLSAANKKTLADIQKEEELRKMKLATASSPTAVNGVTPTGKRYAELASKPTSLPSSGTAWSTVGAGGKVKVPTGPAAALPTPTARAAIAASGPATGTKSTRPTAAATRSTTTGSNLSGPSGVNAAQVEFIKWARGALSKGLNADINVDEFVQMLSEFPPEAGVIADSVYANSQLMDGRRFAEEFLRRKKLADKGVVETASSAGFSTVGESKSPSTGGWNEVAKKGPPKEEPTAGFKVVPNKKKGKK